ncbi:MAG: hypothetical protein K2X68_02445 [Novosphingobium sp.]|nr:hypothetical protein [Novosphingobium sp.]
MWRRFAFIALIALGLGGRRAQRDEQALLANAGGVRRSRRIMQAGQTPL